MKKTSIYVYNDINSFLEQMNILSNEYNQIDHYCKYIVDIDEMRNQLKYLKNKHLLCCSGYYTKKTIKLTISDKKQKYCLEYLFKSQFVYKEFRRELRKMGI